MAHDVETSTVPQHVEGSPRRLTTQHIGRLGELLVQYELLLHGIDSAPMTTDSGVDLVAYSAARGRSFTIQVKTNLAPKPGGGKGMPAIDWWVDDICPAEIFALVDISTRRVWLFEKEEFRSVAQQRSSGRAHLYMYAGSDLESRHYLRHGDYQFSKYLFPKRVNTLFYGRETEPQPPSA